MGPPKGFRKKTINVISDISLLNTFCLFYSYSDSDRLYLFALSKIIVWKPKRWPQVKQNTKHSFFLWHIEHDGDISTVQSDLPYFNLTTNVIVLRGFLSVILVEYLYLSNFASASKDRFHFKLISEMHIFIEIHLDLIDKPDLKNWENIPHLHIHFLALYSYSTVSVIVSFVLSCLS